MHSMRIDQFQDYDAKGLYEYILLQNETEFQVVIGKKSIKGKSDDFDVFYEYYLSAYVGQQLSDIADSFAYYVPSVYKQDFFWYELEVKDPERLADVLHYLITGIYEKDVETTIRFHDEAMKYFERVFDDREMEVACWGMWRLREGGRGEEV